MLKSFYEIDFFQWEIALLNIYERDMLYSRIPEIIRINPFPPIHS